MVVEMAPSSPRRFEDLRGVRWRIDLGILPSSSSSSIDDIRRVTADSRRRYAALRRRLLVDPQIPKDGNSSPELVIDNPLSQNPDSMWGRFFRGAELERMVDQDLSRLYPEHGSYFQTPGCQGILRRILLLWCLMHPHYGYRQGMHELLAPLLYVLHVDVDHLSEVRKLYEDLFSDKFDGFSFHENDLTFKFDFKKFSDSMEDGIGSDKCPIKTSSLNELDPKIQTMILLSDAYGAEGELGIVLSEKFMEHDAYCMFDALMNGAGGAVAMAEFFAPSPFGSSNVTIPPVIEASAALYHLLSVVDSPLHSHLVELGVEPQYFALRWLRVLFGREFVLSNLLIIWDEIFACENGRPDRSADNNAGSSVGLLDSCRGSFITAFAVSMMLHLRSSLLATENPTSSLQKLLNFPNDINLSKLIDKAKSLQALATESNNSTFQLTQTGMHERNKAIGRCHSLSADSASPKSPLNKVAESYWEEKWRVLHKEEELKSGNAGKQIPTRKKGWSEKVKLRLSRTESDPSPSNVDERKKGPRLPVRRSLLDDLARQLGSDEDTGSIMHGENSDRTESVEANAQEGNKKDVTSTSEQRCLNGNAGSEENSSIFSDSSSPHSGADDHENGSGRTSVASNLSMDDYVVETNHAESCASNTVESPLPLSDAPDDVSLRSGKGNESMIEPLAGSRERKLLSGKFQWFWKFGRNGGEAVVENGSTSEATKASSAGNSQDNVVTSSTSKGCDSTNGSSKGDSVDQNVMVTIRNLGQSMLENIQVIESVFQQDRGSTGHPESFSKSVLVGKGQVTAMAALKELRKISNLLSEM